MPFGYPVLPKGKRETPKPAKGFMSKQYPFKAAVFPGFDYSRLDVVDPRQGYVIV